MSIHQDAETVSEVCEGLQLRGSLDPQLLQDSANFARVVRLLPPVRLPLQLACLQSELQHLTDNLQVDRPFIGDYALCCTFRFT